MAQNVTRLGAHYDTPTPTPTPTAYRPDSAETSASQTGPPRLDHELANRVSDSDRHDQT